MVMGCGCAEVGAEDAEVRTLPTHEASVGRLWVVSARLNSGIRTPYEMQNAHQKALPLSLTHPLQAAALPTSSAGIARAVCYHPFSSPDVRPAADSRSQEEYT